MFLSRSSRKTLLLSTLLTVLITCAETAALAANRGSGPTHIDPHAATLKVTQQVSTRPFTTKTVSVSLKDSETFRPPRVQGDREFGGNGPQIRIMARYYVQGNRVYSRLFMEAAETRITAGFLASKPSVARGWSRPRVVYTPPKGWVVRPFDSTDHRLPRYTDTDHDDEVFDTPVGKVTVKGDREGNDIGYTGVHVDWNYRLKIVIERRADVVSPQVSPGTPEG